MASNIAELNISELNNGMSMMNISKKYEETDKNSNVCTYFRDEIKKIATTSKIGDSKNIGNKSIKMPTTEAWLTESDTSSTSTDSLSTWKTKNSMRSSSESSNPQTLSTENDGESEEDEGDENLNEIAEGCATNDLLLKKLQVRENDKEEEKEETVSEKKDVNRELTIRLSQWNLNRKNATLNDESDSQSDDEDSDSQDEESDDDSEGVWIKRSPGSSSNYKRQQNRPKPYELKKQDSLLPYEEWQEFFDESFSFSPEENDATIENITTDDSCEQITDMLCVNELPILDPVSIANGLGDETLYNDDFLSNEGLWIPETADIPYKNTVKQPLSSNSSSNYYGSCENSPESYKSPIDPTIEKEFINKISETISSDQESSSNKATNSIGNNYISTNYEPQHKTLPCYEESNYFENYILNSILENSTVDDGTNNIPEKIYFDAGEQVSYSPDVPEQPTVDSPSFMEQFSLVPPRFLPDQNPSNFSKVSNDKERNDSCCVSDVYSVYHNRQTENGTSQNNFYPQVQNNFYPQVQNVLSVEIQNGIYSHQTNAPSISVGITTINSTNKISCQSSDIGLNSVQQVNQNDVERATNNYLSNNNYFMNILLKNQKSPLVDPNNFSIPTPVNEMRHSNTNRNTRKMAVWKFLNPPAIPAVERLKKQVKPEVMQEALIKLLDYKSKVIDDSGNTHLMVMASHPKILIKCLGDLIPLVSRLSPDEIIKRNKNGYDALYLAAINCPNLPDVTGYLAGIIADLEKKGKLVKNTYNKMDDTLVHAIAAQGDSHTNILLELVAINKFQKTNIFDLSAQNKEGKTPLHIAVEAYNKTKNCIEIIKILIENGAQVNIKEHNRGNTALHIAVMRSSLLVKTMLRYLNGCSAIGVCNYQRNTPLHLAAMLNHVNEDSQVEICRDLINAGSSIKLTNMNNKTPLALVIPERKERIKRIFYKKA